MRHYDDLAKEINLKHCMIQYQASYNIWINYGNSLQEMHCKLRELKDNLINKINKH